MKRKGLVAVLVILLVAIVACLLIVRAWSITPHGRLDWRVAVFLKLTPGTSFNPAAPLEVTRKRLLTTVKFVSGPLEKIGRVEDMKAGTGAAAIPVRVYIPEGEGPFPIVVFYHGGGWVEGGLDTHDNLCRILAKKTGAAVVSVAYRLAPEHPFPAATDDSYAALKWTAANARLFNGDPGRVAVAGDSAGGNLAAAVCLMARDFKGPALRCQVLIYPSIDLLNLNTESYAAFSNGYRLTRADVQEFIRLYIPDRAERGNPYASPLLASGHRGLPPALIITAEFDVLRSDGELYAEKLRKAGVPATVSRYRGVIHGFASAERIIPHAHCATDEMASVLRKAFGTAQGL